MCKRVGRERVKLVILVRVCPGVLVKLAEYVPKLLIDRGREDIWNREVKQERERAKDPRTRSAIKVQQTRGLV